MTSQFVAMHALDYLKNMQFYDLILFAMVARIAQKRESLISIVVLLEGALTTSHSKLVYSYFPWHLKAKNSVLMNFLPLNAMGSSYICNKSCQKAIRNILKSSLIPTVKVFSA